MNLFFRKFGSGGPLIILHGLYGSGDNWYTIGKNLSSNYTVYLVDQRNHGRSEHNEVHTYRAMQEDLLEFYESNRIDKAILIGHSMGGKTAMLFSLLNPGKTEKLIVVDISPKNYKILEIYKKAFKSIDLDSFTDRKQITEEFLKYVPDLPTCNYLLKNLKPGNDGRFSWTLNVDAVLDFLPDMLDGTDFSAIKVEKSNIAFPVMFVKGENSIYISEDDKPFIRNLFPKAEFVTIFDAGHNLHVEQPQAFLSSVRMFLNEKE
jgi:esterase